ncbi:hypothetical protein [Pyrodictium abyssi]|uniref:hypothetical protein n=1 Tax=Pyrodictium abyssi TaxID=54256 RepID=UPI0030C733DF
MNKEVKVQPLCPAPRRTPAIYITIAAIFAAIFAATIQTSMSALIAVYQLQENITMLYFLSAVVLFASVPAGYGMLTFAKRAAEAFREGKDGCSTQHANKETDRP